MQALAVATGNGMIRLLPIAALLLACSCNREEKINRAPPSEIGAASPPAAPAPQPKPREPTAAERLQLAKGAAEAIKIVRPTFTDTVNDLDIGGVLLAFWADKNAQPADFIVARDETTHALVLKDPEEERGKRACTTGTIVQIQVRRKGEFRMNEGIIVTDAGNLWRFVTGGNSGSLVQGKVGRVCGVVVGKHDYSNSGGGVGHAVMIAGMFDLSRGT